MMKRLTTFILAGVLSAVTVGAAPLGQGPVERLNYTWRLKGGLSWLARIAFPTSGRGTLETNTGAKVSSRLMVNASDEKGYYLYESEMLPQATTLMSRNAYVYKDSHRDERVSFDLVNHTAHIDKTTNKGHETKTQALDSATPQDMLTSIYYLRQHADEIVHPKHARLYSGARGYDVIYQPKPVTTMRIGNADVRVRPYSITPVDRDSGKFNGTVNVWLSDDERHLPVQIDFDETYATLRLYLQPEE